MRIGRGLLALTAVSTLAVALLPAVGPALAADAGGTWGRPFRLAHGEWVDYLGAAETLDDGTAVATWLVDDSGGERVYAAHRAPGADEWSASVQVTPAASQVDYRVVPGRHGTALFWMSDDGGAGQDFWRRFLRADGTWGPVREIVHAPVGGWLYAARGRGNSAVVVVERDLAYLKTRGDDWRPLPPHPGLDVVRDGIAVDHDRVTMAVTGLDEDGKQALLTITSVGGGPWSAERVGPEPGRDIVLTGGTSVVSAATNLDGDLVVGWKDVPAGADPHDPVATWVSVVEAGEAATAPHMLAGALTCAYGYACVDVGLSGSGVVNALWWDVSAGAAGGKTTMESRFSRRDPETGDWSQAQLLVDGLDRVPSGSLDVHPEGTATVDTDVPIAGDEFAHPFVCPATSLCGAPDVLDVPVSWYPRSLSAGPDASATYVWAFGCRTEECYSTGVAARSLAPAR